MADNMDAVWIALIAAGVPFLSTIIGALILNWNTRKVKEADNNRQDEIEKRKEERQDEIERRVAEAAVKADEVADHAREAARLLAENTAIQVDQAKILTEKVDKVSEVSNVIHTLVNSKLTSTTQKLRDRTSNTLEMMRQFSPERVSDISRLETDLDELNDELVARKVAQDKVVAGNLDK